MCVHSACHKPIDLHLLICRQVLKRRQVFRKNLIPGNGYLQSGNDRKQNKRVLTVHFFIEEQLVFNHRKLYVREAQVLAMRMVYR